MIANDASNSDYDLIPNSSWYLVVRNAISNREGWTNRAGGFSYEESIGSAHIQVNLMGITREQVASVSEVEADTLDALVVLYRRNALAMGDRVSISINDILQLRGLIAKRSGTGCRGGFRSHQSERVMNALAILQRLYVIVQPIDSKTTGKRVEGYLLAIEQNLEERTVTFVPSAVLLDVLSDKREVALHPIMTLRLHPIRQRLHKRMMRYLTFLWRINANKKPPMKVRICVIVERLGNAFKRPVNKLTTIDRLKSILEDLQNWGFLQGWSISWDMVIVDWVLQATPPLAIASYYGQWKKEARQDK